MAGVLASIITEKSTQNSGQNVAIVTRLITQ